MVSCINTLAKYSNLINEVVHPRIGQKLSDIRGALNSKDRVVYDALSALLTEYENGFIGTALGPFMELVYGNRWLVTRNETKNICAKLTTLYPQLLQLYQQFFDAHDVKSLEAVITALDAFINNNVTPEKSIAKRMNHFCLAALKKWGNAG